MKLKDYLIEFLAEGGPLHQGMLSAKKEYAVPRYLYVIGRCKSCRWYTEFRPGHYDEDFGECNIGTDHPMMQEANFGCTYWEKTDGEFIGPFNKGERR